MGKRTKQQVEARTIRAQQREKEKQNRELEENKLEADKEKEKENRGLEENKLEADREKEKENRELEEKKLQTERELEEKFAAERKLEEMKIEVITENWKNRSCRQNEN